jgi:hypothetical protein
MDLWLGERTHAKSMGEGSAHLLIGMGLGRKGLALTHTQEPQENWIIHVFC